MPYKYIIWKKLQFVALKRSNKEARDRPQNLDAFYTPLDILADFWAGRRNVHTK